MVASLLNNPFAKYGGQPLEQQQSLQVEQIKKQGEEQPQDNPFAKYGGNVISESEPITQADRDMALNPELSFAKSSPQESHDMWKERGRGSAVAAKHAIAAAVGAPVDIPTSMYDLAALGVNAAAGTNLPYAPKLGHAIEKGIDSATNQYTQTLPKDKVLAGAIEGGVGMLSGGFARKGIQAIEQAPKWIKRFSNLMGSTSSAMVAAGTAGGAAGAATSQALENAQGQGTKIIAPLVASIGAGVLTHGAASAFARKALTQTAHSLGSLVASPEVVAEKTAKSIVKNILKDGKQGGSIKREIRSDILSGDAPYLKPDVVAGFSKLSKTEQQKVLQDGMKDYVKFLVEVEQKQGVPLTAGELTSSPALLTTEDAYANNPLFSTMSDFLLDRKVKLYEGAKKVANSITEQNVSDLSMGTKISEEIKNVKKKLYNIRKTEYEKDLGELGNAKIIPVDPYIKALKKIAKRKPLNELEAASSGYAKKDARRASAVFSKKKIVTESGEAINIPDQKLSPLQINRIINGLNKRLKDGSEAYTKMEQGEIKASLYESLNAAEMAGTKEATILKQAKENYRKNSQLLNEIDESYIGNKLEMLGTPERIAKAFERSEPSELRQTIRFLEQSPEKEQIVKEIQKFYLEGAIEKATADGVATSFSTAKFLKNLPKKEVFDIVFQESTALDDIKQIIRLAKKASEGAVPGSNSRTQMRQMINREESMPNLPSPSATGIVIEAVKSFVKKGSESANLAGKKKIA